MTEETEDGRPADDQRVYECLKHARELFIYHAGQRHQSIRFYIIAIAATVGAFGALIGRAPLNELAYLVGAALCLFVAFVTIVFWLLDARNAELVSNNEDGVRQMEARLAALTGAKELESMEKNDRPSGPSYSRVMPLFFGAITLASLSGAVLLGYLWRVATA